MAPRLANYLRTYRKRAGLSQDEVAYLLGCSSGTKVSRYERGSRQPGLEAALGCEVVFGVPMKELLAGVFEKVEHQVLERARRLRTRLAATEPDRQTGRKLQLLARLMAPDRALIHSDYASH